AGGIIDFAMHQFAHIVVGPTVDDLVVTLIGPLLRDGRGIAAADHLLQQVVIPEDEPTGRIVIIIGVIMLGLRCVAVAGATALIVGADAGEQHGLAGRIDPAEVAIAGIMLAGRAGLIGIIVDQALDQHAILELVAPVAILLVELTAQVVLRGSLIGPKPERAELVLRHQVRRGFGDVDHIEAPKLGMIVILPIAIGLPSIAPWAEGIAHTVAIAACWRTAGAHFGEPIMVLRRGRSQPARAAVLTHLGDGGDDLCAPGEAVHIGVAAGTIAVIITVGRVVAISAIAAIGRAIGIVMGRLVADGLSRTQWPVVVTAQIAPKGLSREFGAIVKGVTGVGVVVGERPTVVKAGPRLSMSRTILIERRSDARQQVVACLVLLDLGDAIPALDKDVILVLQVIAGVFMTGAAIIA